MTDQSVVIIGLPASGKTTFLAALWHLITEREFPTSLRFNNLRSGDVTYLNEIATLWRDAKKQDRTAVGGSRIVSMNLMNAQQSPLRVTFPDLPGEAYLRMWEDRDCEQEVADVMNAGGVLLFVHADTINAPQWVIDEVVLSQHLNVEMVKGQEVEWHARLAPTQVQLVDLLQLLRTSPLDIGPRKLAIMLSAWDKAEDEGLSPQEYLIEKLPLLAQYLACGADDWSWQVYGISAQGGDYDNTDLGTTPSEDAERLRNLDSPSLRIQLVRSNQDNSNDITEPLAWLME
ncbi:hypothetical protein DFS28_101335 [Pseudomonas sp. 478]|uniref:TRAFAC clade GTPase domain-containing protein n=1 Tax=unclassified Pseudomonas TaxID=196821 RepID=UPI000DB89574|nr:MULTISPECIES: hypothetical protein [unclassified Pseudomonas]PZX01985.1 hypothetical protein DFS28_101335 [Pseudomonas sp. 478]TCV52084.1 hypothetical protein EDB99_106121 [Pseudomonas sp. 460]